MPQPNHLGVWLRGTPQHPTRRAAYEYAMRLLREREQEAGTLAREANGQLSSFDGNELLGQPTLNGSKIQNR